MKFSALMQKRTLTNRFLDCQDHSLPQLNFQQQRQHMPHTASVLLPRKLITILNDEPL